MTIALRSAGDMSSLKNRGGSELGSSPSGSGPLTEPGARMKF